MNHKPVFLVIVIALFASACSSLPGLRVLTGEDTGEAATNRVVEDLDLVMADKTGATDPSLMSAADRIEAATGTVDIIEIRRDIETDTFRVNMLFVPPEVPETLEGQAMLEEYRRRAFELTWQALLPESQGSDKIHISLLIPRNVSTLDSGVSFIGYVAVDSEIAREDAAAYLSGERNLSTFFSLIVDGTLTYVNPENFPLYEGQPNHPLFAIAQPEG